jgi:Mce-associated membrane protein
VVAESDTVDEIVRDVVDDDAEGDSAADAPAPAVEGAEGSESGAKQPVGRKWLQRNSRAVIVASVASFVVAGAFAGAAVQPYLADRATVATKMTIAATAAKAITTLWSYTPEDMDSLSDRSAKYLGGGFEQQYRQYVDAIAATNKQAKVTSSTQVVGAAVESLLGNEATAIVYTNTTSTTPQNNNIPSLKYLSYRLELQREGRDWRVTKMTTVTSLDLTPKLGL